MRHSLWAALLVAGCGVVPAESSEVRRHVVEMQDFAFAPDRMQVQPGDTVVFVNRDAVAHTATAVDGGWNSGSIATAESGVWIVDATGEQSYYCIFHSAMRGVLVVGPTPEK